MWCFLKNTEVLESISYIYQWTAWKDFYSHLLLSLPLDTCLQSEKRQKKKKGDYTSTHVHTCKNAHFTDTNNCTLLTERKKSFLKTSLTELELHNSSVGGFFFFFFLWEWGRRSFHNSSLEKQVQKWYTGMKKAEMDMKSMEGFDSG